MERVEEMLDLRYHDINGRIKMDDWSPDILCVFCR